MPESILRIQRSLSSSARRVAWLSVGRACALGAAAIFFAWAVATLAVAEGALRIAVGLLVAGVLFGAGFGLWRLRGLRARMSAAGQAAAFEAVRPELRGGLSTVVDRMARPMGSPGLFARLADDVARRLDGITPADVWPGRPLWLDTRWTVVAAAALVAVAIAAPVGPVEALRALISPRPAAAAATPVRADGPHALLGDITLRYVYPAYTRLDPLVVPNTNGEVHAPLGTRVEISARTAVAWPKADLVVTGQDVVPAELVDGRAVSGAFVITAEGTWAFDFGEARTAAFLIRPDPDLAPTVVAKAPKEVAADARFPLGLAVQDDYGLLKVVAEVTVGGRVREVELRKPLDAPRTLNDQPSLLPADLGLSAGDVAKVRIAAWDNDEVSGSKPGWSSTLVLTVVGKAGRLEENRLLREALLAALVPPLADFLVDPAPVASDGAAARAWSDEADARYAAFDEAAAGALGLGGKRFERRIVENVNSARRDLFAFVRGLPEGALGNVDLATLGDLHAKNVRTLEMAVWSLDKVARSEAYDEIVKLARQLADDARDLRAAVKDLSDAQALARLDRLARQMEQLETLTSRLDRGGMRSFLESRKTEIDGAVAAARRDLATSDDPALEGDLSRVAELLDEMAGGVEEKEKRGGQGDDSLAKAVKALDEELGALAASQEALRKKTQAAREKHGQSLDSGMKAWERVVSATRQAQEALDDPALDSVGSGAPRTAVGDARHDADGLGDSVKARDTRTSLDRSEDTLQSIERAKRRVDAAVRSGQLDGAEGARAQARLDDARRAAGQAQAALEELAEAQSQGSPELSRALGELSRDQEALTERAERAVKQAEGVAQQMQSDASGVEEATKEGAKQAGRAGQGLAEGDAMGSEGAQAAAADSFLEAQEALRQAVRDQQEMERASGGGGQEGEEQAGAGGEEQEQLGQQDVTLPAPEEFQTPEAYRKALLEGMQGKVPEAWRAASRRYYEELVRQ